MTPEVKEQWLAARTTHGAYKNGRETIEHAIWRGMLARCQNPKAKDYPKYGARGIKVCERWQVYENFLNDMGPRPSMDHSLDRRDNNGSYNRDNCRWATRSEQQKNKTATRRWRQDARTGTLEDWGAWLCVSKQLLLWRWKNWGTFRKGETWELLSTASKND